MELLLDHIKMKGGNHHVDCYTKRIARFMTATLDLR